MGRSIKCKLGRRSIRRSQCLEEELEHLKDGLSDDDETDVMNMGGNSVADGNSGDASTVNLGIEEGEIHAEAEGSPRKIVSSPRISKSVIYGHRESNLPDLNDKLESDDGISDSFSNSCGHISESGIVKRRRSSSAKNSLTSLKFRDIIRSCIKGDQSYYRAGKNYWFHHVRLNQALRKIIEGEGAKVVIQ
ncbi:hypothetical protein L2E82_28258 [Cichorium intybus]|uniref:Uncharacterized protein n=1 Tax=Cichorium intybus TaxID=13427 RepID=A0ACB9CVF2_CICIN|nr:hypothetical protein L2E82_28258 [Cichorium intybus]